MASVAVKVFQADGADTRRVRVDLAGLTLASLRALVARLYNMDGGQADNLVFSVLPSPPHVTELHPPVLATDEEVIEVFSRALSAVPALVRLRIEPHGAQPQKKRDCSSPSWVVLGEEANGEDGGEGDDAHEASDAGVIEEQHAFEVIRTASEDTLTFSAVHSDAFQPEPRSLAVDSLVGEVDIEPQAPTQTPPLPAEACQADSQADTQPVTLADLRRLIPEIAAGVAERVAAPAAATSGVVHQRITCDGCEQRVVGVRYKCAQCPDFDLCEACEAKDNHAVTHFFIKMRRPVCLPRGPLLPELEVLDGREACGHGCSHVACGHSHQARAEAAEEAQAEAEPATDLRCRRGRRGRRHGCSRSRRHSQSGRKPERKPEPAAVAGEQDEEDEDATTAFPEPPATRPMRDNVNVNAVLEVDPPSYVVREEDNGTYRVAKHWTIRNSGNVPWQNAELVLMTCSEGVEVQLESPDGPTRLRLPQLQPGARYEVSAEASIPARGGRHCAALGFFDGDGTRFGEACTLNVDIVEPNNDQTENQEGDQQAVATTRDAPVHAVPDYPFASAAEPEQDQQQQEHVEEEPHAVIAILNGMGFFDNVRNHELIREHSGDVQAIVAALVA